MLFNSFNFWIIFPFIFLFFWIIPSKQQLTKKIFLITISYLLYINWDAAYSLILLGITLVTFYGAKIISNTPTIHKRRILIALFTTLSFLPLLIFKYYNFIITSVTQILTDIGFRFELPGLNWAIPIGISFFSFQAIGYLLDVYHNRTKAEHNIIDYTLFVSFFPQITSGPISKAEDLIPQLKNFKPFEYTQATSGLKFLLWGMFLKVVVADRLGIFVNTVYENYQFYSGIDCFIASIFYSIQIYGDFAGYSLMALGIAKCLGIDLINNFERPYLATSITSFWKRWHISLTQWLTRQIYIPLGGSRTSKIKTYRNILITFIVSGIWHGANWTFIIWGVFHGIIQIIEKALNIQKESHKNKFITIIRIIITFLLVNFAWIIFRIPSIDEAWDIITKIFTSFSGDILANTNNSDKLLMLTGILILLIKEITEEFFNGEKLWSRINFGGRFIIYTILFIMIISIGVLDSGQFIYVSF